jgi:hypothetical protein
MPTSASTSPTSTSPASPGMSLATHFAHSDTTELYMPPNVYKRNNTALGHNNTALYATSSDDTTSQTSASTSAFASTSSSVNTDSLHRQIYPPPTYSHVNHNQHASASASASTSTSAPSRQRDCLF